MLMLTSTVPSATDALTLLTPPARDRLPSALSASSLNAYLKCERSWAHERLDRVPTEPGLAATAGTHAHRVLQVTMDRPKGRTRELAHEFDLAIREKVALAIGELEAAGDEGHAAAVEAIAARDDEDLADIESLWFHRDNLTEVYELACAAVDGYFAMASPERVKVIANELAVSQVWETRYGPVPVRGFIDRLDELASGASQVVDYKGLAVDEPLPTPTGWTTMGAVEVGDELVGADGCPTTVIGKSQVHHRPCYRITFDDGTDIVCDNEHLWQLEMGHIAHRATQVVDADELYRLYQRHRAGEASKHEWPAVIPNTAPLELPEADLPLDPYVLGLWLGDHAARGGTCRANEQDRADLDTLLRQRGEFVTLPERSVREQPDAGTHSADAPLRGQLAHLELLDNRHIPALYLRASATQRLELLRGLMDTGGSWHTASEQVVYVTTVPELARGVEDLVAGLGCLYYSFEESSDLGQGPQTAYRLGFAPAGFNPFRLPAKRDAVERFTRREAMPALRAVAHVEAIPSVPTQCVMVDAPDSLYLAGRQMVPTHNTGKKPSDHRFGNDLTDYERQILIYAAMVWHETGKLPTRGLLLYVTHQHPVVVDVTQERVDAIIDLAGRVWAEMHARFPTSYRPNAGPLCGWCPMVAACAEGTAEVRRRAAKGTGKGGLREDAPARELLQLEPVA